MRSALNRTTCVLASTVVSLLVAVACTREAPASETQLVVFAAASLREVFTALSAEFEREREGVAITFNFAGTQELRTQLEQGASADVIASADQKHMDALLRENRVKEPVVFARNEPVVVVAKEQRTALATFADLPNAKRLVIGTPEVPIGRYTLAIFDRASQKFGASFRAQLESNVVSRELNVKQVLAKVSLGEADAGIVYRTDAHTAERQVSVLAIPEALNVLAEYPIAIVTQAPHPQLAAEWTKLVLSNRGRAALERAGFLVPE